MKPSTDYRRDQPVGGSLQNVNQHAAGERLSPRRRVCRDGYCRVLITLTIRSLPMR